MNMDELTDEERKLILNRREVDAHHKQVERDKKKMEERIDARWAKAVGIMSRALLRLQKLHDPELPPLEIRHIENLLQEAFARSETYKERYEERNFFRRIEEERAIPRRRDEGPQHWWGK